MIEIVVLFLGVGTFAAPATPGVSETQESPWSITEDMAVVFIPLPGSENLEEKAMPLSKLVTHGSLAQEEQNLVEKSQVRSELPGTRNLAEKRIPEPILEKLSQLPEIEQRNI